MGYSLEVVVIPSKPCASFRTGTEYRVCRHVVRIPKLDKSLIACMPAFRCLNSSDLERVLRNARSAHFPATVCVFEQDKEARSFFLLLAGHIRVVKSTTEGNQFIVRYINPGEFFGIAIAMCRDTFPANAVAVDDCIVLSWPNTDWSEFQARFPSLGDAVYGTIGVRLQEIQQRVMEMTVEQVEQRIARTLLRLVNQSGRITKDGVEIDFPMTQQELAEMAGTTLHTVSRLLGTWEVNGFIRRGRRKVIVTDVHQLLLVAENRHRI